eukprot:SAG31_NODE_1125_length_9770_cov_2.732499_1_plen_148_part_10
MNGAEDDVARPQLPPGQQQLARALMVRRAHVGADGSEPPLSAEGAPRRHSRAAQQRRRTGARYTPPEAGTGVRVRMKLLTRNNATQASYYESTAVPMQHRIPRRAPGSDRSRDRARPLPVRSSEPPWPCTWTIGPRAGDLDFRQFKKM